MTAPQPLGRRERAVRAFREAKIALVGAGLPPDVVQAALAPLWRGLEYITAHWTKEPQRRDPS